MPALVAECVQGAQGKGEKPAKELIFGRMPEKN
jgi:hypothetical protein